MIPSVETYVVVAMAFSVFSAVTAIGASLIFGVGYERLRSGLERLKEGLDVLNRQTGFFSNSLFTLERKVEMMEKSTVTVVHADAAQPKKTRSKSKKPAKNEAQDAELVVTAEPDASISISASQVSATKGKHWDGALSEEEARDFASYALDKTPDLKIRFM